MLALEKDVRENLYRRAIELIEVYRHSVRKNPVSPLDSADEIRAWLETYDFSSTSDPLALLEASSQQLTRNQVHTTHRAYYGLFNPSPSTMGIVADLLVAAFNPQLAAWNHSPFAIETEQHLIRSFGEKFGYDRSTVEGTFASGGGEANHTAILCALSNKLPRFREKGLFASSKLPLIYSTTESHHSITKAARLCGLGDDAVRPVPLDEDLRMDASALARMVKADAASDSRRPLMVIGTAGTTAAGAIDPLLQLSDIAHRHDMWMHVDAAWGGAAVMVPELQNLLDGCRHADSITFDCHKWMSIPMGAGLLLTRHRGILKNTFATDASYMPPDGRERGFVDPYASSMQWSRRFIGLKVFLSLAERGWKGYEEVIRHHVAMGDLLRHQLTESGWQLVNRTPLPLACFKPLSAGAEEVEAIREAVVSGGRAWLSKVVLGNGCTALRACITNFATGPEDIELLVGELNHAREKVACATSG